MSVIGNCPSPSACLVPARFVPDADRLPATLAGPREFASAAEPPPRGRPQPAGASQSWPIAVRPPTKDRSPRQRPAYAAGEGSRDRPRALDRARACPLRPGVKSAPRRSPQDREHPRSPASGGGCPGDEQARAERQPAHVGMTTRQPAGDASIAGDGPAPRPAASTPIEPAAPSRAGTRAPAARKRPETRSSPRASLELRTALNSGASKLAMSKWRRPAPAAPSRPPPPRRAPPPPPPPACRRPRAAPRRASPRTPPPPRRSGRPSPPARTAAAAPRCRPPSAGRRRSSGCARRTAAPSPPRRRWSPCESLTIRTPRQVGDRAGCGAAARDSSRAPPRSAAAPSPRLRAAA